MPKNKPELKKLSSEGIRALQTAQKTTPQEKSWFEQNGAVQNTINNRTTKNWVEEDWSKFSMKQGAGGGGGGKKKRKKERKKRH